MSLGVQQRDGQHLPNFKLNGINLRICHQEKPLFRVDTSGPLSLPTLSSNTTSQPPVDILAERTREKNKVVILRRMFSLTFLYKGPVSSLNIRK